MVKANPKVTVALDAMGGDHAPGDIVEGAVMAVRNDAGVEVALVGPPDIVEAELAKYDIAGLPIRCVPADETIKETENPALAVRRKPKSSMAVAARMLRDGEAEGLISAGPTGAIATSGIQYLGMIEGMERPVIGGAIFDALPNTVFFDCGVNMDCRPYHLLTFAVIGTVYCKKLLNIANPTVGLLNIGVEETKGNQLTRETYPLLKKSSLNFIGNIEGNQIMSGQANVIACDAFVGNVLRRELLSRAERVQQLVDECTEYLLYMAERTGTLWENQSDHASCNHGFASHAAHVLLVGHNPGFTDFANRLSSVRIDNLPTAGLFCVDLDIGQWSDLAMGDAQFVYFDAPKNDRGQPYTAEDF